MTFRFGWHQVEKSPVWEISLGKKKKSKSLSSPQECRNDNRCDAGIGWWSREPPGSPGVPPLRRPSRRCCRGWSRSGVTAGCPGGSSSSCGSAAPASAWSWRPTSSAAWSRPPPPPPPPLLPLGRPVSSGRRRRRTTMTTGSDPATCAPDACRPRRCWSPGGSTGRLQQTQRNVGRLNPEHSVHAMVGGHQPNGLTFLSVFGWAGEKASAVLAGHTQSAVHTSARLPDWRSLSGWGRGGRAPPVWRVTPFSESLPHVCKEQ